ncbi:UNVERIFIED_CONTAM: hypothetical protein FKN15_072652 [Acipenser sinensis]
MNTRCPPKRVPSADHFFSHCGLTMQPPKSYSVGGQHSSRAAYRQARRRLARLQGSLVRGLEGSRSSRKGAELRYTKSSSRKGIDVAATDWRSGCTS